MLLTRVFEKAQLPVDGHRKDEKCPATTKKIFSAISLKLQGLDTEGEKEKEEGSGRDEEKEEGSGREEERRSQREDKLPSRRLNLNLLKNSKRKRGMREVSPLSLKTVESVKEDY